MEGRWLAAVAALVIVGVSSGPALAFLDRSGAAQLRDDTLISSYTEEWIYTTAGPDADVSKIRNEASGGDGEANASDVAAYLEGLRASLNGSAATHLAWDGNAPVWWDLNVTAVALINGTGTKPVITFTGKLLLNSSAADEHILTIQKPSTVRNFQISLSTPANWTITNTTGLSVSASSQTLVVGTVSASSAQIEVSEPQPPSPPPLNDTTPPVVNAGIDRTAVAGELIHFSGAAADVNNTNFTRDGTFWWSFVYNQTPLNLSGMDIGFVFWVLGSYVITFTAMDQSGNWANDSMVLTIGSPDLVPPTVNAGADRTAIAGQAIPFVGQAVDNDPEFSSNGVYGWRFDYNGSTLTFAGATFTFAFYVPGTYHLTLEATDGWGNRGTDEMVLTIVPPDQLAPVLSTQPLPTVEFGHNATITGVATDNDPAFPEGALFWWTFTDNGSQWNQSGLVLQHSFMSLGRHTLAFTAVDVWGNRAQIQVEVDVLPPDRLPPEVNAGEDGTVEAGTSFALNGQVTDNDPEFPAGAEIWWRFSHGGTDIGFNLTGATGAFVFPAAGVYEATLWARDAWGNTASDAIQVTVGPAAPGPGDGASGSGVDAVLRQPFLLLGLIGIAALGVFGLAAYRRRSGGAGAEATIAPAPDTAPAKPSHVVEAVLILNRDGRLIHFQASGAEASIESPEVIGSMFTAVTEFIRDSFGKEGALSRLTYGQNTIMLERSKHLFGAVIVYGEPDAHLVEVLSDVLRRLEISYAGLVERWTGDREAFEGIAGFVSPLFALTSGLTRADIRRASSDKTVRLGSGTEHYKGYIRLRVAMVNQTEAPILDARVTVLFNQSVLRLARVEPAALKTEGLTVHLGAIAPGERLGASFYLDPQTCSQTNIEGVGVYTDATGESRTVKMKPRVAEIVCPLFFTPQHANPAMMRRLIDTSLGARDSKLYRVKGLPPAIGYGELFNAARETVQRHHVVLVRNIKQKTPFEGTAWFYGQTKHSRSPVIIRVTVSEKRRSVEFFVAVDSPASLTGMLAEFARSFTEVMRSLPQPMELETVIDERLKAIMSAEGLEDAPPNEEGNEEGAGAPAGASPR